MKRPLAAFAFLLVVALFVAAYAFGVLQGIAVALPIDDDAVDLDVEEPDPPAS